jgi:hypothetical protein
MFKAIMHYPFKLPQQAFDITKFHQHGLAFGVEHEPNGASAQSGAMLFNGQSSRVHVPFHQVWQELTALKIEALVRIDSLGQRRNIVEGSLSFSLFVRADGVVTGTFLGPPTSGAPHAASNTLVATLLGGGSAPDPFDTLGLTPAPSDEPAGDLVWHGVNTEVDFAPDGQKRTLQPGVWTRVTFIHNGFSLQLWLDDELAGYRDDIDAGVMGVQPEGVHIGAWPTGNKYFLAGALDEIKIWKLDPTFRSQRLFCRTMDFATEYCLRGVIAEIVRREDDPETRADMIAALSCLRAAEHELLRAVHRKGREAIVQAEKLGARYDELWCRGEIDGPEMAALLADFARWLDGTAGPAQEEYLRRLLDCRQHIAGLDVDQHVACIASNNPALQAFAKLVFAHGLPGYLHPLRAREDRYGSDTLDARQTPY